MSYRNFNHLLGESDLERKCRFCFGLGIFILVSGSFCWYGQKTESLVRQQTTQTARMLVNPALLNIHYKALDEDFASILKVLESELRSRDGLPDHEPRVLATYDSNDPNTQPRDEFERATIAHFASAHMSGQSPRTSHTFADGSPTWSERITNGKKDFQYIQAVFFTPSCLMDCHGPQGEFIDGHSQRAAADGLHRVRFQDGDLAGAVVINLPMAQTYKAINNNRAILITAALVTAILAMVASYMVIRYIIIRPLKLGFEV